MDINKLIKQCEKELTNIYKRIDNTCYFYSNKVLSAMQKNNLNESCFNSTTGYGYNDLGRDVIENIYKDLFHAEDALVRNQFISGSHALSVTLFALLRPNDTLLSITGTPYDTLHEVIGIKENESSLKNYNVKYDQIDLVDDDFDYERIKKYLTTNKVKVIEIQRSRGYSTRKSLTIDKVEKVIKMIKSINKDIIIMVDNCYCEMVEKVCPIEVGANIMVGSLIKNLGAGIASNGAYVVGDKNLVKLVAERLTLPGEGKEVGPTLGANKDFLKGLFFAPSVVASALKVATLTSLVMEKLGYKTSPRYDEEHADIVLSIEFNDAEKLIKFVGGIQAGSPVDSNVIPIPWDMPGYDSQVIMASGSFTQGSSIELSCDGPIRPPYIAYMQGSLTYEYGVLGLIEAIRHIS